MSTTTTPLPPNPSPTSTSISLHVSIYIDPNNRSAFLTACRPVFEAIAQEPQLTYFELFSDPEDEGHLCWVENWNGDKEWFMTEQITKAYYKPYLDVTEPMFLKPREVRFYERMGRGWTVSKEGNVF